LTSQPPASQAKPDLTEADHYDAEYRGTALTDPADPQALGAMWHANPYAPFNRDLLRLLGPLEGKTILLLGNGVKLKELHLLTQRPARLIFTDLSPQAVERVRSATAELDYPALEFKVVDALAMPFEDGEIDVVYGYAFAHHLPDLPKFLAEVKRVLRPGGRAVFMDNAEVPLWQKLKTGLLRPLMHASHRINPISEADRVVTEEGWYSADELAGLLGDLGVRPLIARSGLTHYVVVRALQTFQWRQRQWVGGRVRFRLRRILWAFHRFDRLLARSPRLARNQIRLVWGFELPTG